MKKTLVHITKENGTLSVKPDPVPISKKDQEQVEWICHAGGEFTIDFRADHNCPFEWVDPKQKGKADLTSGRIKFNAKTNTNYKYDVECDGIVVDPEVSIKP